MNKETQAQRHSFGSRFTSIALSAAMLVTSFAGLGALAVATPSIEADAASSYNLPDYVGDGVILHAWNWSFNAIKANMEDIAAAGYTAVQTSPVQRPKDYSSGSDQTGWWKVYQPTSLSFSPGGHPWFGSKDDFKAMCDEAEKYGVKVIVDVVANHMANDTGSKGNTRADICSQNDPTFRDDDSCWHLNGSTGIDYGNQHRNGDTTSLTWGFGGWPDLNTGNKKVQNAIIDLLKECVDLGADGFRFDAAKHIELPTDPGGASDFWPTVTSGINNYAESQGKEVYLYGEILDDSAAKITDYTQYIAVTDNRAGNSIRYGVRDGNVSQAANSSLTYNGVPYDKIVLWSESHDTYANDNFTGESAKFTQEQIDRAWAIIAARQFPALYYIRPSNNYAQMGQPSGNTSWKSKEMTEVNKFHNAMTGESEWMSSSGQCVLVERGEGGVVIVNINGSSQQISAPVHTMANGTYKDQVSGGTFTVSGGQIKGQIGSKGIAVVYNADVPSKGSVSASPATGTTFTDTLSVTLNCSNVTNAKYSTSEGASGSYTNGQKITVGASTSAGSSVTVNLSGTKEDGSQATAKYTYTKKDPAAVTKIYFDNSSYNWKTVYAYIYVGDGDDAVSNAKWPGVQMTKGSSGFYEMEVPENLTNGRVIFTESDDATKNRYPADQQPGLSIGNQSMKFGSGHSWEKYSAPVPVKDPTVTADKASGTKFTTETLDITLTLANAVSGTYSVDNGPTKTFTGSKKVTIGQGKIGDSTVTVKTTAKGSDGTTKSYTFTYEKDYVVKTASTISTVNAPAISTIAASSSSALGGKYATNPSGQVGKQKTITGPSDFTEDMIIAQGVANDDPRIFRGSHEGPVYDTYALYGAWDSTNLYLGWQFTNVTDVVDPAQGYPISDNGKPWNGDIPQMIALNLGKGSSADMSKGTMAGGKYVWDLTVGFETDIDALMCFSSKPGVGQPALFKTGSDGYFSYDNVTSFTDGGISFKYQDGFFGSKITGIKGNGYDGYTPSNLTSSSSNWVDFLTLGHDKNQDTFYYMTIPLSTLGITKSYLESNGIGVMHISTFGKGGTGCIPMDMTMLDNATEPYAADESTSAEKEDIDVITVPLARIGQSSGSTPDPDIGDDTPLQVNFGTDRSAPQLTTTALTLKAVGYSGTAPYTYQFSVDGNVVKAYNSSATYSWKPGTSGSHTIKCIIKDSTGKTATVSKTFTAEGDDVVTELVNNSTISSTSVNFGSSITLTGKASGGTSPYTYKFEAKHSTSSSYHVIQDFNSTATTSWLPGKTGTYTVRITVKDKAGKTAAKSFTLTVKDAALTNSSTISSTSVNFGSSITLTGKASGGTSPYTYKFEAKHSTSSSYHVIQDFNSTATTSWLPGKTGTYTVRITVKDKAGKTAAKSFTLTVKDATLTNSSTISSTSVNFGSSITLKGKASGGTSPYTYKFEAKHSTSSSYHVIKDFSSTATTSWLPGKTGTYTIRITVKDKAGKTAAKSFTITVKDAVLTNSSTISSTSVNFGKSITLTGKASGGTSPYTYKFESKHSTSSSYHVIKDFSSTATTSWQPGKTGTYTIRITVKDKAGKTASKTFTLTVKSELQNNSKLSATSIKLGSSVKVTGSATGGTAPYTYSYYYRKTTTPSWTAKAENTTSTSVTITPGAATSYEIKVVVKDSTGNSSTRIYSLTVTK